LAVTVKLPCTPELPVVGKPVTLSVVAGPAVTVKALVRAAVPPPGAGLVTETFRAPVLALVEMLMLAVSWVFVLFTLVEFTLTFGPKLTAVFLTNPVPVRVTWSVCPNEPVLGEMPVSVGATAVVE
jgi:hypothetical protein